MALVAIALLLVCWPEAQARPPELKPTHQSRLKKDEKKSPYSIVLEYEVLTDYADNRTPRGYTHGIGGALGYKFNPTWSVLGTVSMGATTVGGQIPKTEKESYSETISPSAGLTVSHKKKFWGMSSWKVFAGGTALLDEGSRREGYKGLLRMGTGVGLAFSNIGYMMGHMLSASNMLNTFEYGTDKKANPQYSYVYAFSNSLKFYKKLRFGYIFGVKATRYLDGFVGYAHSNKYSVSYSWEKLSTALIYENGGFTDQGYVDFWYINQHRRLLRLTASYTF